MERLMSFAELKSEPPLQTDNDKRILERAAASSTQSKKKLIGEATETQPKKTEAQLKDEQLLSGTEHTVPAELASLVRDISRGFGAKRQVHQTLFRSCGTYNLYFI